MTKEQAIKILKADETDDSFDWDELGLKGTEDYNRAWNEAYDMAIEALEESRNMTNEELYQGYIRLAIGNERLYFKVKSLQERLQRKIGYWKWQLADNGWADHICSECGWKHNTDIHVTLNWQYCPNCGAKMESEEQTLAYADQDTLMPAT